LVVGHGGDSKSTMGPVTTERSLDKALAQVEDAKKHGGKLVMGGNKLQGGEGYDQGYFFEPTIITGASKDMLIAREETFAPVLALFAFDTEEEAVKQANDTSMGLASCEWPEVLSVLDWGYGWHDGTDYFTKNIDRTWRLFENLEAGMIGMNTGNSSAAETPFGGIKESGYGKESGKDVAIAEYMVRISFDLSLLRSAILIACTQITKTGTLTLSDHYWDCGNFVGRQ
jgi:succinate-semialdehyde dehydrogenase/glutarate-semialdehyde dehydrogenase